MMTVEIEVLEQSQDTREYSFSEIKKEVGVYRPTNPDEDNVRIIVIDSKTVLFVDTLDNTIEGVSTSTWKDNKFERVDDEVVISFKNDPDYEIY